MNPIDLNSLWIVSDLHGNIDSAANFSRMMNATCIQLGDLGVGFHGETPYNYNWLPESFHYIRGNHDNPHVMKDMPGYLGDFAFIPTTCGAGMFVLSGAHSVDRAGRTPGRDWWPEEELDDAQMGLALALYKECQSDILISHECPAFLLESMKPLLNLANPMSRQFNHFGPSRTACLIDQMYKVRWPKVHIFGHYHFDLKIKIGKTLFVCLDVEAIKEYRKLVY